MGGARRCFRASCDWRAAAMGGEALLMGADSVEAEGVEGGTVAAEAEVEVLLAGRRR